MSKVDAALDRSRRILPAEDYELLEATIRRQATMIETQAAMIREQADKLVELETRIQVLSRKFKSEKGKEVLDKNGSGAGPAQGGPSEASANGPAATPDQKDQNDKKPGHGRIPISAYPNAERFSFHLEQFLQPGCACPKCHGTLYKYDTAQCLRIEGRAPLWARCAELQQSRCSGCGHVYTAQLPPDWQGPKYHESAASMMAVLHYGSGMPGLRLERLQAALGTPIPCSTQWQILNEQAELLKPAFHEMCRQAAQADFIHSDDTSNRLLSIMGKRRAKQIALGTFENPDRTGIFTTAFVSQTEAGPIVLFRTGRKHAGENFTALLEARAAGLDKPGHMCDGLGHNRPKGHEVDPGNCLAHARRHVVDQLANFPAECGYVIEQIGLVYAVDKRCKLEKLQKEDRLLVHQRESGPVMEALKSWLTAQLADKRVEPNSGVGKAFNYMLKRWTELTLFLRRAGAPLDNNICEQAFKRVIKYRKNSLFYLTERGAEVGDLYMSLIHTAELHNEDPFAYLTALQVHAKALAEAPADWMPWNYRKTLAAMNAAARTGDDADKAAVQADEPMPAAISPLAVPAAVQNAAIDEQGANLARDCAGSDAAPTQLRVPVDPEPGGKGVLGGVMNTAHMLLTLLFVLPLVHCFCARLPLEDWAHCLLGPVPAMIVSARPALSVGAQPIGPTPRPPDTS